MFHRLCFPGLGSFTLVLVFSLFASMASAIPEIDYQDRETRWILRSTYHLRKNNDLKRYVAILYFARHYHEPGAQGMVENFLAGGNAQNMEELLKTSRDLLAGAVSLAPHPAAAAVGTLMGPATDLIWNMTKVLSPNPSTPQSPSVDFMPQMLSMAYGELAKEPEAMSFVDEILGSAYGIRSSDLNYDPETSVLLKTLELDRSVANVHGQTREIKESLRKGVERLNEKLKTTGDEVLREISSLRQEARSQRETQKRIEEWNHQRGELQGAVDIFAFVAGRVDPKLGRSVQVMGSASVSIMNSVKMFNLNQIGKIAMSANILSAGLSIISAFGGGGDPVMEQLGAIMSFLEQMAQQLNRIEQKVDAVYELLQVQFRKIHYDLTYLKRVSEATHLDVQRSYTRLALLNRDIRHYIQALSNEPKQRELRRCFDHDQVLVKDDFLDTKEFWACLTSFYTAATHDAYSDLWTEGNWDFRPGEVILRLGLPVFSDSQNEKRLRYDLNYLRGLAETRYGIQGFPERVPDPLLWRQFADAYARMALKNYRQFPTYPKYTRALLASASDISVFFARTLANQEFHWALIADYARSAEEVVNRRRALWNELNNNSLGKEVGALRRPIEPCEQGFVLSQPEGAKNLRTLIPSSALIAEELEIGTIQVCNRTSVHDIEEVVERRGQTSFAHRIARIGVEIEVAFKLKANDERLVLSRSRLETRVKVLADANALASSIANLWEREAVAYHPKPSVPVAREGALRGRFTDEATSSVMNDALARLGSLLDERFEAELSKALPLWDPVNAVFIPPGEHVFLEYQTAPALASAAKNFYETYEIMKAYVDVGQYYGAILPECLLGLTATAPENVLGWMSRSHRQTAVNLARRIQDSLMKASTARRGILPATSRPVCLANIDDFKSLRETLSLLETVEAVQSAGETLSGGPPP